MAKPAPATTYKLPAAFLASHRGELDALDWAGRTQMELAPLFPNAGFEPTDALEIVRRPRGLAVRSKDVGTMKRMRAYAETLPPVPGPSEEEIAAVLAKRNPQKETASLAQVSLTREEIDAAVKTAVEASKANT